MGRIFIVILFIFICWRFGNWRRWKDYYPTILFFLICHLLCAYIMGHKSLWVYKGLINHSFSDLLITFTIFPCTTILYFTFYPNARPGWHILVQVRYILCWVMIYFSIELVMNKLGYISYNNGWNIWWSALMDIIAFLSLIVHYKKPLAAWLLIMAQAVFFMQMFDVSITSLK